MQTSVHSKLLPGVTAEETPARGREIRRDVIYADGEFIGEVIYIERHDCEFGGIEYGWRPANASHATDLTCRVVAVSKLPRIQVRKVGV